MKIIKRVTTIAFIMLLVSCKSTKILSTGEANYNLTKRQLIKENQKQQANFKTMEARVKIEYTQNNKSQSYSVTYRMEKDKVIWISAPFNVVRAKITPEKVSFYNKLDNTYFDGDFSYLSDLLGTELDFEKVQNILLGEPVYSLKEGKFNMTIHENSYLLEPEEQQSLFDIFFLLNPSHFKLDSQQVAQTLNNRMLEVDYLKYQQVNKQTLPELIKVIALDKSEETIINLEFKSVSLNEDLRFPFKIPSGYDEIQL